MIFTKTNLAFRIGLTFDATDPCVRLVPARGADGVYTVEIVPDTMRPPGAFASRIRVGLVTPTGTTDSGLEVSIDGVLVSNPKGR